MIWRSRFMIDLSEVEWSCHSLNSSDWRFSLHWAMQEIEWDELDDWFWIQKDHHLLSFMRSIDWIYLECKSESQDWRRWWKLLWWLVYILSIEWDDHVVFAKIFETVLQADSHESDELVCWWLWWTRSEMNCNMQEKDIARLEKWISMNSLIQSSHKKIRSDNINQEKFEN